MLLFEIGDLEEKSRVFDTGYIVAVLTKKKKQATNDLLFFSSNIIQRADLE